jgi:hypothetical protein
VTSPELKPRTGESSSARRFAAAIRMSTLSWLRVVRGPAIPESIQGWGLGRGESEVLALALQQTGARAVLDDLAARRCARFLGVPVVGTGKLLVLAKRQALLSSAREPKSSTSASRRPMPVLTPKWPKSGLWRLALRPRFAEVVFSMIRRA